VLQRTIVIVIAMLSALAGGLPALAELHTYEGFEYTVSEPYTSLNTQDGGSGWAEPWASDVGGPTVDDSKGTIESPGMTFGTLLNAGNRALLTGNTAATRMVDVSSYPPEMVDGTKLGADGSTLWLGFLTSKENTSANSASEMRLWLRDNSTQVEIGYDVANNVFAVTTRDGSTASATGVTVDDNEIALIVLKIEFGDADTTLSKVSMWVNPDVTLADPGAAHATVTDNGNELDFYDVQIKAGNNASWFVGFDEIRFGEAYADVTPTPSASAKGTVVFVN
jgi:hypothetical protein